MKAAMTAVRVAVTVVLLSSTWLWTGAAADTALGSWTISSPQIPLAKVIYGSGVFVARGEAGTFVSQNGTNWTGPVSGAGSPPWCYGGGRFVSVPYAYPIVVSSTNGLKWETHLVGTGHFSAIAYGRGRFVAGGNGGWIGTSTNIVQWTYQAADTSWWFYSLAFGKGVFVAGGGATNLPITESAVVWTSRDGVDWQLHGPGESAMINSLAYGRGKFVAVVPGTGAWTSPDGQKWHHTLVHGPGSFLWRVAYGNGVFLCTGYGGAMYSSPDGEVWEQQRTGVASQLYDAAFGKGRFVVGGESVLVSGVMAPHVSSVAFRLSDTFRLPDGAMLLTIEAPYGREVVVEASEDMASWKEIARDPCDRGEFEVYDEAAKDLKQRYYRARQAAP